MSGFFKKLMATGAVLTLGLANVALADNSYCPQPPCAPNANWCDNVSVYGSWLYWKVSGDEFDYAVHKERTTSASSPSTVYDKESIHDLKFKWNSGFRIGVTFDAPVVAWGFDVNWTHFDTSSSTSDNITASNPTGTTNISFPVVDNAYAELASGGGADFRGHSNFRYNTIDIEMGKWCCCGNGAMMFRPHIGFRIADIHESFSDQLTYTGTAPELAYPSGGSYLDFHTKNRFKGGGLRAGLDVDFRLCDGWSLIGRSAISSIWGHTHLKNNFGYNTTTIPTAYGSEIKEHYKQTRFITDLSLGVRYKTMACGCYPLTIEAAWEHHYLFNQHRFWVDDSYYPNGTPAVFPEVVQTTTATNSWKKNGDVAFSGLTLTVGVDF